VGIPLKDLRGGLTLTRLPRLVERLVGLDDVDERRRLHQDFGVPAHGGARTPNGDADGRHGGGAHGGNLRKQTQRAAVETGSDAFRPLKQICTHCRPKVWGHIEMSLFFKALFYK